MTMVRPCRLITRQRSHIGLTDGLTFIVYCHPISAIPVRDPAAREVVRLAKSPSVRLHEKHARTFRPVRTRHGSKLGSSLLVRIFGPESVTATVCSKCADSE